MSKRFSREKAEVLLPLVREVDPTAIIVGQDDPRFETHLGSGCNDPGCCVQWNGPASIVSLITTVSATRLHKMAVAAGLVAP